MGKRKIMEVYVWVNLPGIWETAFIILIDTHSNQNINALMNITPMKNIFLMFSFENIHVQPINFLSLISDQA